jgi:hypothetical protein
MFCFGFFVQSQLEYKSEEQIRKEEKAEAIRQQVNSY